MISVFLSATCLIVGFFLYRKIEEIRSDRRQHLCIVRNAEMN